MSIFEDKTEMPKRYEHVATAMCREDTDRNPGPMTPRLSGEEKWPERVVSNLQRPRRGHGY